MQSGYTKYPCFLCKWDSRADREHYSRRIWPERYNLHPGSHNIIQNSLVNPNRILLPPLHIKLGIMKNVIKALDQNGSTMQFLRRKFPKISEVKITAGILNGPQIRELIHDNNFDNSMNVLTLRTWIVFKSIIQNFLGNHRSADYENLVDELMDCMERLGSRMSIKMHFLRSHLDYFPSNCGDFSEEQGERFHQDIAIMEDRYQGRWDVNMHSDYCWCLKRDDINAKHKRKAIKQSFI